MHPKAMTGNNDTTCAEALVRGSRGSLSGFSGAFRAVRGCPMATLALWLSIPGNRRAAARIGTATVFAATMLAIFTLFSGCGTLKSGSEMEFIETITFFNADGTVEHEDKTTFFSTATAGVMGEMDPFAQEWTYTFNGGELSTTQTGEGADNTAQTVIADVIGQATERAFELGVKAGTAAATSGASEILP